MTDFHRPDRSDYAGLALSEQAHHNREASNRARQAAEALFAPKPRINKQSAGPADPTVDKTGRKPRILSAVQVRSTHAEPTEAPTDLVPPKPTHQIPASHLGRVRAWMKYGMTIPQVAKVYGVAVVDIERILDNPD